MFSSFRKWIYKGQCNKLHSNRIFRIKWITWTSIILIHSFITVCFLVLLHFTEVFTARLISFTNQTSNHFTYQCIPSGSNVVVLPRYSPLSMCTPLGLWAFCLPSIFKYVRSPLIDYIAKQSGDTFGAIVAPILRFI